MSEEQPMQPQASQKPRYKLDDAGCLTRIVGTTATPLAVYADGIVTILAGRGEFEPQVRKAFDRMGKPVSELRHESEPPPTQAPKPTPTEEPPTEPHLGERTPAWLAWCKENDPERYAKVCARLKISDQTET